MARAGKSGSTGKPAGKAGAPAKPRTRRAKPAPQAGGAADSKDSAGQFAEAGDPVFNPAPSSGAPSVAPTPSSGEAPAPEPTALPAVGAAKSRSLGGPAKVAAAVGVAIIAIAAATYVLAPHRAPTSSPPTPAAKRLARASCSLDLAQSFKAPPGIPSIAFRIDATRACVNAGTPYERTPGGFSRIIPNAGAGVVSVLTISPDLTTLQRKDFPVSPKEFALLHAALGSAKPLSCSPSDTPATASANRSSLARIRALAQPYISRQPTRQITWRCAGAN